MINKATGLTLMGFGVFLFGIKHLAEAIYEAGTLSMNSVAYKDLQASEGLVLAMSIACGASGLLILIRSISGNQSSNEDA